MGRGLCPHSPPPEYASEYILLIPVISSFYSISNIQVLLKLSNIQPSKESSLSYPVYDLLLLVVLSSIRPSFTLCPIQFTRCPIQYPTFFYSLSYPVSDLLLLFVLSSIRPSFTLCPIQYPTFFYSLSYPVSDLLLLFYSYTYLQFFLVLFNIGILSLLVLYNIRPAVITCPIQFPTYRSSLTYPVSDLLFFLVISSFQPTAFLCPFLYPTYFSS